MALKPTPHRRVRVPNAPLHLRDLEDSRDRPEIGRESVGERSLCEKIGELGQSISRNEGGAAGTWLSSKGGGFTFLEGLLPETDRHRRDSESSSHLHLREPQPEQGDPIQATFLESGGVPVLLSPASHGRRDIRARILRHLFIRQ